MAIQIVKSDHVHVSMKKGASVDLHDELQCMQATSFLDLNIKTEDNEAGPDSFTVMTEDGKVFCTNTVKARIDQAIKFFACPIKRVLLEGLV